MKLAEKRYTVWVGGMEVNDYLLTKEQAEDLAFEYEEDGYDEVAIGEYSEEELKKIKG